MAALLVVDAGPLRLVEPVAAVVRRPLLLAAAADELAVVERVAPAVRSVLHVDHLDVAGQLRQRRVQRRRLRRQRRPAVDRRWAARASRRCHTHTQNGRRFVTFARFFFIIHSFLSNFVP